MLLPVFHSLTTVEAGLCLLLLCFALHGSVFSCLLSIWLYHPAVVFCLMCCSLSDQKVLCFKSGHSPFVKCIQTDRVPFNFLWHCKPFLYHFCLWIILVLVMSCQLTSSNCWLQQIMCISIYLKAQNITNNLKGFFSCKIFSGS